MLSLLGATPATPRIPQTFFRVCSSHRDHCACRIPGPRSTQCHFRASKRHSYDRAAHWSAQTEAQLYLWTPEIYECISIPITINREVDTREIDDILGGGGGATTRRDTDLLQRYLHFDFDVETRLREIGWRLRDLFKPAAEPAEIRARSDAGTPLVPDRSRFCVSCCAEGINWPEHETRDLQGEAEQQIVAHGYVRKLPTAEEYELAQNLGSQQQQQQQPPPPRGRRASWSCVDSQPVRRQVSRGRRSQDVGRRSGGRDESLPTKRVSFSPTGRLRMFHPGRAARSERSAPVAIPQVVVPRPATPPSPSLPLSDFLDLPSSSISPYSQPPSSYVDSRPDRSAWNYGDDISERTTVRSRGRSPPLSYRERRAWSRNMSADARYQSSAPSSYRS